MGKILRTFVISLCFIFIINIFLADKGFAEPKIKPECKYYSTAEVVDGEIINKKEKITCVEEKKPKFLVSAMTGESSGIFFQYFFGTIFFIIENL